MAPTPELCPWAAGGGLKFVHRVRALVPPTGSGSSSSTVPGPSPSPCSAPSGTQLFVSNCVHTAKGGPYEVLGLIVCKALGLIVYEVLGLIIYEVLGLIVYQALGLIVFESLSIFTYETKSQTLQSHFGDPVTLI